MTSWVVADSSIFLASVLQERLTSKAQAIIKFWAATNVALAAPALFQYEIVAVLRKNVYQGRITTQEGIKGRDILLSQPIQYMLDVIYFVALLSYLRVSIALQLMMHSI